MALAGCGGSPAENPNYEAPSGSTGGVPTEEEITVDDGIRVLRFVSASPDQIGLKGQGGTESSIVTFRVTDTSEEPLSDIQVSFELDTQVGGVELRGSTSVFTGPNGLASITVSSGTVSAVVHVVAKIVGTDVSSISPDITVSTGVPVSGRLAVGADWHAPGTFDFVGVDVNVNIVATDQFGNYAFDGTRVGFWSPYTGGIASSCTLKDGECEVIWNSTPNAGLFFPDLTDPWVKFLVFAAGAEAFTDTNGNNLYDEGEQFTDLGEAYLDVNENGMFDSDELFVDTNENGVRDEGNGVYDGPCLSDECPGESSVTIWAMGRIHVCPMKLDDADPLWGETYCILNE